MEARDRSFPLLQKAESDEAFPSPTCSEVAMAVCASYEGSRDLRVAGLLFRRF